MKTVAVCIACNYEALDNYFVMSLLEMQAYFDEHLGEKYKLSFLLQGGYNLDAMRNEVVDIALMHKQDYIIMLDTDMSFPRETIVKLVIDLEKDKRIEAVTGLYIRKSPPFMPHVYFKFDNKTRKFSLAYQFPLDVIFPVAAAGCGCLAIKSKIIKKMKPPYFKFKDDNIEEYMANGELMPPKVGEDMYFFLKSGIKCFCDPTIQCKHYKKIGLDILDYIKHNNIEGDRKGFKVSDENWKKILEQIP